MDLNFCILFSLFGPSSGHLSANVQVDGLSGQTLGFQNHPDDGPDFFCDV